MSTNDITGDNITTATKHNSKAFRDNYDAIFNKEKKMKAEQEEKQYVYSIDDETFNIESEDEVIELALEEGCETYSRGVVKHIPKHYLLTADVVIDIIADNAWDVAGDVASDFPDVSVEGKEELDKFLVEWLDKYCTPWFYLVEDVVEIKIKKEQAPFDTTFVPEELPKGLVEDEV